MSEKETESSNEPPASQNIPRKDLLDTAVRFLQNPKVQRSALAHQQAFLKSKGLTDEEIGIACERASALTAERQVQNIAPITVPVNIPQPYTESSWTKFRDTVNTVVVIGGLSYGLFLFYKQFVSPWLFGAPEKKKSIEQSVSDLDIALSVSVHDLRDSINKVYLELKAMQDQQRHQPEAETAASARQIDELKAEIASIKGLLLNRNQFAAPTTKSPLTLTSIPAWQLTAEEASKTDGKDGEGGEGNKGDADIEDCNSGSGSSGTNNGSDSSLEMIRE